MKGGVKYCNRNLQNLKIIYIAFPVSLIIIIIIIITIGQFGQVVGKVERQNWYFITSEDYVTGNSEDFEEGVGTLE